MTQVHSPRWYRVAGLKPRLSPHLRLRRQRLRGETWYLLSDPVLGRAVRLNAAAYAIAGRLDGQRTVQQVWDRSLQRAQEAATQDEVIDILAQLREAALVQFDRAADFDVLLPHLDEVAKPSGRTSLLAWRIPLINPSAWLDRLRVLPNLLFSRGAFAVWLMLAVMLLMLTLQHGPKLWAHAQLWLATPRYVTLALLLFIPIKLLHELAHGLAVRRWGGQVREAGVTLMLLMPVPYVDASSASSFVQRRHRVVVGAAGIMAEISLAALALPLWLWLEDGWLRDGAFVTLVIAGVSTLLFNVNPLQRLDGYYILTDTLGLPNLGPRSRNWWLNTLRRRLLKLPGVEPMAVARGETFWLAIYAPLAWLYLLLIAAWAISWLGKLSLVLGWIGGALLIWQMVLRPVTRLIGQLQSAALAQTSSARRWRKLAGIGAVLLVLILLLPLPQRTLVQGVVWPPDQAQLRADEGGLVEAVLVTDGQSVMAGDVVLRLTNSQLHASHARQLARVSALETGLFDALQGGGAQSGDGRAGSARAELAAAQAELDRLGERLGFLVLRAGVSGRVVLPQGGDLVGQFLRRGSLVGQVLTDATPVVRVALPEAQATDLRRLDSSVSAWLSSSPHAVRSATLIRDSVGAVMQLPSAALSARQGGDVPTDPLDPNDLKPLQPVVLIDVQLTHAEGISAERIGERAWVRFESGRSPLLLQVIEALRQKMLQRFNPQF